MGDKKKKNKEEAKNTSNADGPKSKKVVDESNDLSFFSDQSKSSNQSKSHRKEDKKKKERKASISSSGKSGPKHSVSTLPAPSEADNDSGKQTNDSKSRKSKTSSNHVSLTASGNLFVDGKSLDGDWDDDDRSLSPYFKAPVEEPDSIPSVAPSSNSSDFLSPDDTSGSMSLSSSVDYEEDDSDFSYSRSKPKKSSFWKRLRNKFTHIRDSIRTSEVLQKFHTGNVIILVNKHNKMAMRVTDFDDIDCRGRPRDKHDEQLHFLVTNFGWNVVSLKSMTFPLLDEKFLCIHDDDVMLHSDGSMHDHNSRFRLHETRDKHITLESYVASEHHIGFDSRGELIPPDEVPDKEACSQFRVKVVSEVKLPKDGQSTAGQAWDVMR